MLVVGLTGPLGAGKSTVAGLLARKGAAVIDTDEAARVVTAPGTPGAAAVIARFGPGVEAADGTLDRHALASIVFSQRGELSALEAITHPLIRQEVQRQLSASKASVTVVELPLLDERRRQEYALDVAVLIDLPEDLAIRRAVRRGITAKEAESRLAAQPTRPERHRAVDRVVKNDGTLETLERRVDELWQWLLERATQTRPAGGERVEQAGTRPNG